MTTRRLLAPTLGTGVGMCLYLLLRPYGDTSADPAQVAAAFASPRWVGAHLLGMVALTSAARLALRLHDITPGPLTRAGRWSGLAGLVLVLPYYGAETFAVHVLGSRALAGDPGALVVAQQIRDHGLAMGLFGLGLALLALSGWASAQAFARLGSTTGGGIRRWAAWPLGACIALVLPQFFLPPAGRMAFGLLTLAAALLVAVVAARPATTSPERDLTPARSPH